MKREFSPQPENESSKRRRQSITPDLKQIDLANNEYGPAWADWPAPRDSMQEARRFLEEVVGNKWSVLLVPDKDADGLSAGSLLYKTLILLGHPKELISVHVLNKGISVHSDEERARMVAYDTDRVILLDQGSRPGRAIVPSSSTDQESRVLIIDHHMSTEWPENAQVLTACHSPPIATTSLLTYMLVRDMHPRIRDTDSWRAVIGVVGDLGTSVAKWGVPPWPSDLGITAKLMGSKAISDAVAGINAPRRTAEYDVPKAWTIMLESESPAAIASNAYLKLCRLDVNAETERWARTPPKFSVDGRVAVITINTGFQVHPVIATRWAGNLGRKSSKLIMIMCANTGFNPDPNKVSFSCRIASSLRSMPDDQRPNLIALLEEYGDTIEGFRDRVGGDFARGHKEATGGIIPKEEFARLLESMGVNSTVASKGRGHKAADPASRSIKDFFRPAEG